MGNYIRVIDGVVSELFTTPQDFTIEDCWPAAIVGQFIPQPENVQPQQGWTYDGTTFAAPAAPELPIEEQAANALNEHIAQGITITSIGTPSLNCVMALDKGTMDQIGSVARDAAGGLGLPGDADTFTYPDDEGVPRAFSATQLIALYKGQRDLLLVLNTQAAIMAHGGPPTWPEQSKSIP